MKTKLIAILFSLLSLSAFAGSNVIGGTPVDPSDPLAKVTVSLIHDKGNNQYGICSGVIITRNVVLTAAHCVIDEKSREWFDLDDISVVFNVNAFGSNSETRSVRYAWAGGFRNGDDMDDIAIVFFNGDLPEGYQVAELADTDIKPSENSILHVAGYGVSGSLNDSSTAGILRKGTMTYTGAFNNGENFGLTKKNGTICVGDSGGASFLKVGDSYRVYGIVYLTTDGCRSTGLYSSVQGKRNWIQDSLIKIYDAVERSNDIKSFDTLGTIYKLGKGNPPTKLERTFWSGRCFSRTNPLQAMAGGVYFGEKTRFYWTPELEPSFYDGRMYSEIDVFLNTTPGHISFSDTMSKTEWLSLYEGRWTRMRFHNGSVVVEIVSPKDGAVMTRCIYGALGMETN